MRIILDANILVGLLISRARRRILFHPDLQLLMTEDAWRETGRHLARRVGEGVATGRISADLGTEALTALDEIDLLIRRFPVSSYAPFEEEAGRRIHHAPDIPTVALALAATVAFPDATTAIWTEDKDFWGCGVAVWTTEKLHAHFVTPEEERMH